MGSTEESKIVVNTANVSISNTASTRKISLIPQREILLRQSGDAYDAPWTYNFQKVGNGPGQWNKHKNLRKLWRG